MKSHRLVFLLSFPFLFLTIVSAAKPTSFCKCTCGSDSEIVALNAPISKSRSLSRSLLSREEKEEGGAESIKGDKKDNKQEANSGKEPFKGKTCNDCNRQFCVDNNLPSCRKVADKEIFTQCFQRDSAKDQAVVFIFIIATVGLLGWALLRPWLGIWIQKARERDSYMPITPSVPGNGESE